MHYVHFLIFVISLNVTSMIPIPSKNYKMHWNTFIHTAKFFGNVVFALMASSYLDNTLLFTIFISSELLVLPMVSVLPSPNQNILKPSKNHGDALTILMLSVRCY